MLGAESLYNYRNTQNCKKIKAALCKGRLKFRRREKEIMAAASDLVRLRADPLVRQGSSKYRVSVMACI